MFIGWQTLKDLSVHLIFSDFRPLDTLILSSQLIHLAKIASLFIQDPIVAKRVSSGLT